MTADNLEKFFLNQNDIMIFLSSNLNYEENSNLKTFDKFASEHHWRINFF